MEAKPDEDAWLLEWFYFRALTTAETDARWFRQKNVKVLRIAIEFFTAEAAAEEARLAKLKWEHDREVWRLKGLVMLSDDDDVDHGSSSDSPPSVDSYSCTGDQKHKGPARNL
ncbi:Phosphorylated carbohydrates phosphatase [Hordeum vulgare]|nr:Phosphorylated carbohydrates phosphatase [Hordeum vulgare]